MKELLDYASTVTDMKQEKKAKQVQRKSILSAACRQGLRRQSVQCVGIGW